MQAVIAEDRITSASNQGRVVTCLICDAEEETLVICVLVSRLVLVL